MWPFTTKRDFEQMEARSSIDFSAFSDMLTPSYSGVSVNESTAVRLPSVYKCIALNAETVSSLPIDVYAKRGGTRVPYSTPPWLRVPNPFQTTAEFVAMTQASLDLNGNAYWLKTSDAGARLAGLTVLAPAAVQVEQREGQLVYWVQHVSGAREPYSSNAVVHLRGLTLPGTIVGLSPIACAKQAIGIGLAAEQFGAQFFGSGANLSGVIETPGQLTQEQAERLQVSFAKKHGGISKSHAIGILAGGATWKQMSVNPEEAQFLQSRQYTASEIASLYGIPPELTASGGEGGAKGYVTALSMRLRLWYLTGLLPRIKRIEDAMSGLLPSPAYVKFNTNALLRMDPAERTAFYQAAQLGEWMTRNEIRALEDMDPVPEGDDFLHSVQWQENAPELLREPEEEPEEAPS